MDTENTSGSDAGLWKHVSARHCGPQTSGNCSHSARTKNLP